MYTRGARFPTRWDQRAVAQRWPSLVSRRDLHPDLLVPAADLSLPFAPSWSWCPGGQTGYTRGECRLPPLGLGVWVRRVILAGSAD